MLRADTPEAMAATWAALQEAWSETITLAESLGEDGADESVDGEWSFVQTLRHLVMAMDKWFTAPILGEAFHPIGLPNTGSLEFPWPGIDLEAMPTMAEALAVRAERSARLGDYLASLDPQQLDSSVNVLENGPHAVRDCILTVFEEEFWHNRYARRDLARLGAHAEV